MQWKPLLAQTARAEYASARRLMELAEDEKLNWMPPTGLNWMSTGQLLHHLGHACGAGFKGFVTGDWGMPEGMKMEDLKPEQMLPPASAMPSVKTVAEALALLDADRQITEAMLAQCDEARMENEPAPAPWDPTPMSLGQRLMQNIEHLRLHKAQLFYYLKTQGVPVNTMHLWGM